jgi:D-arabinose 1-dehydrogenase-like Zn-dependent alcohol dehydrogenase
VIDARVVRLGQAAQDALALAAVGAMTVPIAARYPMDGIDEALGALRKRAVLGRQVLELA